MDRWDREMIEERLAEMKDEEFPVCTPEDVIKVDGADASVLEALGEENYKALTEHLRHFCAPTVEEKKGLVCPCCHATLGGLLGFFQWGLHHGHGSCSVCGWPCTAYHRPKVEGQDEPFMFFELILPAHPSEVSMRSAS